MSELARVRLVIFDFDGVLADTVEDLADAANAALLAGGRPAVPAERVRRFIGGGAAALVQRLLPDADPVALAAATDRFKDEYARRYDRHTVLFPGVKHVLQHLRDRDVLMAVATNKSETITRSLLAKTGIEGYFVTVVGPEAVTRRKPDPEALQVVLARVGAAASESLMVGDTEADILAGRQAGLTTCAVLYGYGSREEIDVAGPDFVIAAIDDLLSVLGGASPPPPAARELSGSG